jgi:(p)ppGpp synthase/HD superfamily hydrolase
MIEFLYQAAIDVAVRAHAGQLRKYTNEPYIVHPFAVAGLVAAVTDDEDAHIAALLHDTVEDTAVTLDLVRGVFGVRIAGLVENLTDVSRPEDGNRGIRKAIDLRHTAAADPVAKTIKLADLIDNTKTITAFDKNFAKVYMHEKQRLLEVLKEGDSTLWALANSMVEKFFEEGEIC